MKVPTTGVSGVRVTTVQWEIKVSHLSLGFVTGRLKKSGKTLNDDLRGA